MSNTSLAEARRAPDAFLALGVPQPLAAVLAAQGIDAPFPIQAATLPDSLAGRDVLGRGRTGSGKTIAFALPTVAALAASGGRRTPRRPRALVLVPTRELANQVLAVIKPLAEAMDQRVATVFGGVGQQPQVQALRAGVDIVVACPGRLEDLINQRHCDLGAVEVTVLDEADHMADLGFLPAVRRLLDATPASGQRLLFSATLDRGVDVLVRRYLHEPVTHSVDPVDASTPTMAHHVVEVDRADKSEVVRVLASGHGRTLLFTRTKHLAKRLAQQLSKSGIPAVDLHGNLSQGARERNLAAFSEGRARVLVATDIAARGIHVDDVGLVVHVDPPADHKAYTHRAGRTARAGASGDVVTVATTDQRSEVATLARQAGITPSRLAVGPNDERLRTLVGPAAPLVHLDLMAPPAPPAPSSPGSARGRRGRPAGAPRQGAAAAAQPARSRQARPAQPRATQGQPARSAAPRPAARPARPGEAPERPGGATTGRRRPRGRR